MSSKESGKAEERREWQKKKENGKRTNQPEPKISNKP